ncbi:MAG: MFS transporter [Alphaproteobacteria bacterium GM7ARS4]|nr:MFS transporter [Alphaproteobacteria bacterium GM7ARS4]
MPFYVQRRFLPLFICQFFGAFNDNLLKSGLSFLVVYQWHNNDPWLSPAHTIQLATAFLVLPFLLFSHKAGSLADTYDKARMARAIKGLEIVIVSITSLAFYWQNTALLLFCVFLMGSQSTFFGPIKYALLPLHLKGRELLLGNACIESSTFIAILIGSVGGGVLSLFPHSTFLISSTVISCALIGWLASMFIPLQTHAIQHGMPHASPYRQDLSWRETYRLIARHPPLLSLIMAISWFWFFGAMLLSQLPLFTKHHLAGDESLATMFLAVLTAGITCGAFSAPPLLKRFRLPHVLIASCAIMGGASLVFSSLASSMPTAIHTAVLVSALFTSAWAGGLYSVPLYTALQKTSPPAILSRCIATNNIVNACLIIGSALCALTLLHLSATIQTILILNSIVPLTLALYYGLHRIGKTSHPLTSLDERHNI